MKNWPTDRSDRSDRSDQSDPPNHTTPRHRRLRPSGGYRGTCGFQTATLIYDATYWFCEKFLDPRSRTVDQMIQAARSGRQNIAEGSRASGTSSQTELRLINVARSSLEELLLDYEDYLRHRHLQQWEPDSPEALAVRQIPRRFRQNHHDPSDRSDPSDQSDPTNLTDLTDQQRWELYAGWLDAADPAVRANATLCLIHQANYLLDQQIETLEGQFVEGGGYSEQLAAARLAARRAGRGENLTDRTDRTDLTDRVEPKHQAPNCPECGKPMTLRTVRQGRKIGSQFWGCSGYPACKGTLPLDGG